MNYEAPARTGEINLDAADDGRDRK